MKATFAISATIDARDTAISNGRLLSDTPGPGAGKHTLKFATTKRMSSYLVALAVGDWECIAGTLGRHPHPYLRDARIEKTSSDSRSSRRSSRCGTSTATSPSSIRSRSSTSSRCRTFRPARWRTPARFSSASSFCSFAKDGGSTERRKQIAQYIAHEIAHQWFGDLVTMEWWDDIWLNEGFATWMEHRPMQEWQPEWNGALDEVRDTQGAMNLDALRATRPIRTKVETPDEINQVFDAIAYQKTAAVIRMVEGYVGRGELSRRHQRIPEEIRVRATRRAKASGRRSPP